MSEERKYQIPTVSDAEVLKILNSFDGSEKTVVETLKLQVKLLADIRVFLRKMYKKLPQNNDVYFETDSTGENNES